MGIRGFTTFVDSNSTTLLQDHKLHSTKIIIDGNNFYHFLYYYLNVKYHYGGDYDVYKKKVTEIFQMFLDCGIQPYIVFDGGYEADGKKMKTVLARAKNRIHLAGFISHGGRGKILPILVEITFKQILKDMGIPYVVCDFEADAQIVKLANELECPVMSNDSDFFVFDLKGGFILFDYAEFRVCTCASENGSSFKYFPVQIYYVDNFCKVFSGFNKKLMPILAILNGNDFIDPGVFQRYLATLVLTSSKSLPQKHRQMFAIMDRLQAYKSCDKVVDEIITHSPEDSRDHLMSLIQKCLQFYNICDDSFSLAEYFLGDSDSALKQHTSSLSMYHGTALPSWFSEAQRKGDLQPFLINIAVLHWVILLCQVEDMSVCSGYSVSETIRQCIYGILLKDDCSQQAVVSSPPNQITHVLEYSRDANKNLRKFFVKPVYSLPTCGPLPGISGVPQLSKEQRVDIFLEIMSVPKTFRDLFSPCLQLVACAIVFWIDHAEPKILKHHYHALLISLILLQTKARLKRLKNKKKDQKKPGSDPSTRPSTTESEKPHLVSVELACKEATAGELTSFVDKVGKHHAKFSRVTNTNPVESSVTHGSSQFQACLHDAINLNKLLQSPLEDPEPDKVFSGTFFYNFTKELRSRSKPVLYIYEILGTKSPLCTLFQKLDETFLEHARPECFQETAPGKKNSKKKSRKKLGKSSSAVPLSDSEDGMHEVPEIVVDCDLSNRFSSLMLD